MASLAGACGSPILANPPVARPVVAVGASPVARPADPLPISLPRDDGPHDRLTEWWYYTGHLRSPGGERFGFEFVVFRAERGDFPVTWASHLALTDETRGRFSYAQRSEVGPQADVSPRSGDASRATGGRPSGFALNIRAAAPDGAAAGVVPGPSWTMSGGSGRSRLAAGLDAKEAVAAGAAFGLELDLTETAPVLHDRDGWVDFGPAGGSYYYSRPRMPARGTLTLGDRAMSVIGEAWFDHQWGDFISVGGGWDWFAVNLSDGTDLAVSLVRDGSWKSLHTGAVYPAGWRIAVPGEGLAIELSPTVADQELDTRPTSGVVYWEGSQHVTAVRGGTVRSGEAYVELTGYAPALASPPPSLPPPPPASPAESAP